MQTQNDVDMIYALVAGEDKIFAARRSGLYCSSNNGETWQAVIESVSELHRTPTTALAVKDNCIAAGVEGAMACSFDGGETWQITGLASPTPLLVDIIFSPYHKKLILAASAEDGVFISEDNGNTWAAWNFGLIDPRINCLVIAPDHSIFAGTESGIFRSHNNGKSWLELPFSMDAAPVLSIGVTARHIFAGTQSGGLFYTDHGSTDWTAVSEVSILKSESIHALIPNNDSILVLTDHHLIRFLADVGTYQLLSRFPNQQALVLAQNRAHVYIGFVDGTINHLIVS